MPVKRGRHAVKPLGGTCMTSAGDGGASACDTCDTLDDKMTFLREETRRHGFSTPDGVHNGPCHVHMEHAHTIGPDGSLYACPGFTGEKGKSTGHIDDRLEARREEARAGVRPAEPLEGMRRLRLHPRVCGGLRGGVAHNAWRHEHADMSQAQLRIGAHLAGHQTASAH